MKMIAKLLKAMNSNAHPMQIGLAMALGMVVGLTPLLAPHNLLAVVLLLFLKLNFSGFTLSWAFFSGLAVILNPMFHSVGETILANPSMAETFTTMYNDWFWRWLDFNNTVVMGSVVCCLVLLIPAAVLFSVLINLYRRKLQTTFDKLKVVKFLKGTKLWSIYKSIDKVSEVGK